MRWQLPQATTTFSTPLASTSSDWRLSDAHTRGETEIEGVQPAAFFPVAEYRKVFTGGAHQPRQRDRAGEAARVVGGAAGK